MRVKLAASIMCADYANIENAIREVEENGVDFIHIDIMDGRYVPNIIIGPDYVKMLRRITRLPLDMHFMCVEPETLIPLFDPQPGERISFHPETTYHAHRVVADLQACECLAGVALSPAYPVTVLEELLFDVDLATVMTIDTGYAGSRFLPRMLEKISRIKEMANACGKQIEVAVDGSITVDNAAGVVEKGADVLILGYAGCFNKDVGIKAALNGIKEQVVDL